MTRDEFYEKYGNVIVRFSHYYKYTFSFSTELPNGLIVIVHYGGNAEQIYRFAVGKDIEIAVRDVEPYAGEVFDGTAKVDEFYDY